MVKAGTLGSILLNSQIITEDDIAAALTEQQQSGCRIGEALVKLGIVTQEDIDWALANQLNIPYIRLKREMIDPAAVSLVPAYLARQYGLMPLIRVGEELRVAMIDPLNTEAINAVEKTTGCSVAVSVALIRELQEVQEHFYGELTSTELLGFSSGLFPPQALQKINSDLTGAILIDFLLRYMAQQNLASVSLLTVKSNCRVVARKLNSQREMGFLPGERATAVLQRLQRLAGIAGYENAAKGTLPFRYKGKDLPFQVLFLRGVDGDCVTMRRQFLAQFPASIEDFMVTPEHRERFSRLTEAGSGIIICASSDSDDRVRLIDLFLDERQPGNRGAFLIGEGLGHGRQQYPRIPHRGVAAGDFSSLLMAVLEHDPDTVAIDDAGEAQVMLAAGKAALKGKLVVAGISCSDQLSLFRYLSHLCHRHHFVPAQFKGIMVCRRVLLLCPHCRQVCQPTADELAAMDLHEPPAEFFVSGGCPQCDYTGVSGRRYLLEVIPTTAAFFSQLESLRNDREMARYLTEQGGGECAGSRGDAP